MKTINCIVNTIYETYRNGAIKKLSILSQQGTELREEHTKRLTLLGDVYKKTYSYDRVEFTLAWIDFKIELISTLFKIAKTINPN